jgi:hypothetical protein
MENTIRIFLILALTLALGNCKDKEEKQTIEEPVVSMESNPEFEETSNTREEIENPSVPSPKSFKNIKEVKGDLDGDKEDELVVVYDTQKQDELGTQREIHVFKKEADKWNLLHKTQGPVLASKAGGMMGDPFDNISIENGAIVINHFGGAREKWGYTHRYRFQKDNWFLIGATIIYSIVCEESSSYDYNLSTGKVIVTQTREACDSEGNPKGKPKVTASEFNIKQKKEISMDGFVPGNSEAKLTKDKNFYF